MIAWKESNMYPETTRTHTHFAKINDKIVPYDATDSGKLRAPQSYIVDLNLWVYIGTSVIWTIYGVNQNINEAMHFWKWIPLKDLGDVTE